MEGNPENNPWSSNTGTRQQTGNLLKYQEDLLIIATDASCFVDGTG
jgi:hypothetical protein